MLDRSARELDEVKELGPPTQFSCPECGGVLWRMPGNGPPRYRCRTGHGFTEQNLLVDQSAKIEDTLWAAMRALEERAQLQQKMAHFSRQRNQNRTGDEY